MKECFKCKETKPLSSFYKHGQMADGHLNKCKECAKADVRRDHREKKEQYQRYERKRNARPERKEQKKGYTKKQREKHPEKYAANMAVSNAVRDGKLKKQPCEICGSKERVEGHHPDYEKPLDVQWLCFIHHRALHYAQRNKL